MDKSTIIKENLKASIEVKQALLTDKDIINRIEDLAERIIKVYQDDGKVLFCGNGGSAADAQHLAAELSGRYYYDRPPLFAEALHVNTSYLTAVANDYSYDVIYERLIKGMGRKGDVLIGLSTSGNSKNVVNALIEAKKIGMLTVGFTGKNGGVMKEYCDILIEIPSENTPRIQECHMLIGHSICEIVEQGMFPQQKKG
ncbi:phosphoheptose isomerase [Brumimicrobium salinarum]|uniref:Phosphoheptose isomerase n=1 Tax=Brumimicrobium salinarum TaxID=2058658 RepID=A0A2I0R4U6_9FLAO|nr:D-sedoheptulose 7-phosphate isomerase [Brumimicrobium salinarum]PKR81603.1 phosphoheptose isomerase [Brumimicrobium salinarum]